MAKPRAADDYAAIRARLEELRRERVDRAGRAERRGEEATKVARMRQIAEELRARVLRRRN
jgi:hypothetical protein